MTIREYFENSKLIVYKYIIQHSKKATIIVPSSEKFDLSEEILNSRIKTVSIDQINDFREATLIICI